MQGPTPYAKLTAMGLNGLASSVRPWFIKASPTVEKAVSCYKADQLVASLLSFRTVQSWLAVHEFCAAGEERCKWGHGDIDGCVQTFDAWCRVTQSASEQLQLCELSGPTCTFGFTTREFCMVGGYTENPENHKTVKIGGWTLLAQDNTVIIYEKSQLNTLVWGLHTEETKDIKCILFCSKNINML